MASFREHSKNSWESNNSVEHINAGSLQRIADATELMAKRHQELVNERDTFKRSKDYWEARHADLERSNRSLRGQITKLNNQLAAAKKAAS